MRTLPTNLCPLIGNQCLEDRCAWWDYAGSECALVTGAFAIREVAENLEELAVNHQARGNLQQEAARSAANTTDGKGGTDLVGPDSILHDTKETEDLQV